MNSTSHNLGQTWPLNKDGNPEWSIRDFAAFFDITTRAVRFYEDKGLLSPRRQSGGRVFSPVDYLRLEKILRAKRLGFTLDDIKTVLDITDGHIQDRDELLRRKENLERVIKSLHRRRDDIDVLTRDMTDICDILSDTLDKIPNTAGLTTSGMSDLAGRYEAAFKDRLSFQGTSDATSYDLNTLSAKAS